MTEYKCHISTNAHREIFRTLNFVPVKSMYLEFQEELQEELPGVSLSVETVVIKVTRSKYIECGQCWRIEGKEV